MRRFRGFGRKALLIACGMALTVAFVLPAGDVKAFSEPIPAKIALIKPGKLFKLVSKGVFSLPAAVEGGSLTVSVEGESGTLTCDLATATWKGLGNPAGSKGWKYVNKSAPGNDPCKIVIVKEKVIKVLSKATEDLPSPTGESYPDVSVALVAGADDYCAVATAPHFKVKAGNLVKMKDQGAPEACVEPVCGDDAVNQAGEQCDGADASECPGLCQANCVCPEPVCNNGSKEVGEECDPAGSTADCGPGDICGGFCTCVPDVACACGSPDPILYEFKDLPPTPGQVCGTTDGSAPSGPNPDSDLLKCMGLYIGGGGGALPVPAVIPDEANPKYAIAQCKGTDLTLASTTQAAQGSRHCTEGTHCVGGTSDGQPCLRDIDCGLGTCEPRCFFTTYVANLDRALPLLSTCLGTVMSEDGTGGVDCTTGKAFTRVPMDVRIHLTLGDQSASTPGWQACPICVGGTVNVEDSGICEGGPNNGLACTPMSTPYDSRKCCAGGTSTQLDCTDDTDCPGSTCVSGCTSYPSSLDCPPQPLTDLGGLFVTLNLNTEDAGAYNNTAVANAEGEFCGWCRDVEVEGSTCFEGDPDEGPPGGARSCPDSAVIACRPATYWGVGGGDPADIVECSDAVPCRSDADCTAPYETCTQRNPGASRDATITTQTYDQGSRPGDLTDRLWHGNSVMVTNICIPPTFDGSKDGQSDLPGPGGISILAEARLSPSGAFMETANGLLD